MTTTTAGDSFLAETGGMTGGPEKGVSDLYQWHLLMRGRYWIALILATLLGAAGAVGGYRMGQKTYQSTATIQVQSQLPKIIYDNEERTISQFDQFIETQVALITGRRVIEMAMRDPMWTRIDPDQSDQAMLNFMSKISVSRRNQLLYINCTSTEPTVAVAGAQSVLNAYRKLHLEEEGNSGQRTREVLQQLQATQTAELQARRQRVNSLMAEAGVPDVAKHYEYKFDDMRKLEAEYQRLLSLRAGASTRPSDIGPLSREEWASKDPELAGTIQERRRQLLTLEEMKVTLLPENASVKRQARLVDRLEDEIAKRIALLEDYRAKQMARGDTGTENNIEQRLMSIKEAIDKASAELSRLAKLNAQINEAKSEMEATQANLQLTRGRLEQLRVESYAGARILPLGDADRPLNPYQDTRTKLGATGATAGILLGLGLVLLRGLLDDRVRHSAQAARGGPEVPTVLGLLPEVPEDGDDQPEQAAEVARALHLIRASLQLQGVRGSSQVLTVTGPLPGSGKTSLTLGLGTSYGKSGAKTLLVDFDLIGRGLSAAVAARAKRKLGTLLMERGVITAEQLGKGLLEAEKTGMKLGEALVSLGMVSRAAVDDALGVQQAAAPGVIEALRGDSLSECIAATPFENVYLMPTGSVDPATIGTISPTSMHRFVEQLRKEYDAVLFDTGPMPGCVESSLAASAADAVVVVVSRGDSRRSVGRTLAALRTVGARCAGLVFNRAESEDFVTSSASMSRQVSRGESRLQKALLIEQN